MYLRVNDGQSVDPDSPAAVLVFDCVMEERAEKRVDHVRDQVLVGCSRGHVGHRDEPLLPDGHLEDGASILTVVVAQEGHVREENLFELHERFARLGLADERCHHFEDHGVFQAEVRLGFRVPRADNLLSYLLSQNLVEDVIGGQSERLLVKGQSVGQEHVEVVRSHDVIFALVRRTGQEEAKNLESHEPCRLAGRGNQLEDGTHSLLSVEGRYHGSGEFRQQRHEQLKHVLYKIEKKRET